MPPNYIADRIFSNQYRTTIYITGPNSVRRPAVGSVLNDVLLLVSMASGLPETMSNPIPIQADWLEKYV